LKVLKKEQKALAATHLFGLQIKGILTKTIVAEIPKSTFLTFVKNNRMHVGRASQLLYEGNAPSVADCVKPGEMEAYHRSVVSTLCI